MATLWEYKVFELEGEFGVTALTLDSLAIDRQLSQQRQDGWELASTGLSVRRLAGPRTDVFTIRITYGLKRAVPPNKGARTTDRLPVCSPLAPAPKH